MCKSAQYSVICRSESLESNTDTQEHVSVHSRKNNEDRNREHSRSSEEEEMQERPSLEEAQAAVRRVHYHLTNILLSLCLLLAKSTREEISLASFSFPVNCHWLKSVADTGKLWKWKIVLIGKFLLRNVYSQWMEKRRQSSHYP
jgi:hypothetical protein